MSLKCERVTVTFRLTVTFCVVIRTVPLLEVSGGTIHIDAKKCVIIGVNGKTEFFRRCFGK